LAKKRSYYTGAKIKRVLGMFFYFRGMLYERDLGIRVSAEKAAIG